MMVKPKTKGSVQDIRVSFLPIRCTIQPPSRPPTAAPTVTMDFRNKTRPCFQPCDVASSYPKPGALHFAEPQPRVGDPAELRDGGGAVTQHEPEAHGTQNGGERGQISLLLGQESGRIVISTLLIQQPPSLGLDVHAERSDPSPHEDGQSVFSTAVSEEMLERTKRRSTVVDFSDWLVAVRDQRFLKPKLDPDKIIRSKAAEQKGKKAMERFEYEEALFWFSKAIYLQPQQTELYVNQGEAYIQLCDFQSAADSYNKANFLDPEAFNTRLSFIYNMQCWSDLVLVSPGSGLTWFRSHLVPVSPGSGLTWFLAL
ncbi:hypothetical protein CCH79_00016240 [Gambusia affinis]|uniref:Uncharacterized protein n=1 Tax=Gambusia affinis TaxID=33528 RepID=A0A315VP28_GAMAF|nr:hypothetical protein CCH79_00016240 [Gambusia affinis]